MIRKRGDHMYKTQPIFLLVILISSLVVSGCSRASNSSSLSRPLENTDAIGDKIISKTKEDRIENGLEKEVYSHVLESNWEVAETLDITHKSNIGGFLNEEFGITVGYAGEIHYTINGGNDWPVANNESVCRYGLDIINSQVAYSCGNYGQVTKTKDAGVNWERAQDFGKNVPHQCRYLSFIDENIGWIAAPKQLAATIDGAETWSEITLPIDMGTIIAIDLLTDSMGYIIDSNKVLYITSDKGISWSSKRLSMTDIEALDFREYGVVFRFEDEQRASLFCYNNERTLRCFITEDQGMTWKEEIIPEVTEGRNLYLSNDGMILSMNSGRGDKITLLKQKR